MKTKHMTKLFAGFSVALAVQTAFAGNITDINVSTLPDNQKIIKIRFDKDVTTPHGFVTSTPARIALDLPIPISVCLSLFGICRPIAESNYCGAKQ